MGRIFKRYKMNSLVSIIIPCYNRAELIPVTLDSIINQSHKNWECIVVDDHSTDNSYNVVEQYAKKDSRIKLYKRPGNLPKGANACRNFGFEVSQGEYVNWFDSDDIMLADFISKRLIQLEDNTKLVACFCSYYISNSTLTETEIHKLPPTNNFFKDYLLWNLRLLTPSPLFRKTFLDKKTLFSTKLSRGQETEFFSRVFENIPDNLIKILNIPLFHYIQHENSKSSTSYSKNHTLSRLSIYTLFIAKFKDKEIREKYYEDLHHLLLNSIINKDWNSCKMIRSKIQEINKSYNKVRYIRFPIEYFIIKNIPKTKTLIFNQWKKQNVF